MLKTTPVTAGLLRPIGLFCVLFGGIAAFEYGGCGRSDKPSGKKTEPEVPVVTQDIGFTPPVVIPKPDLLINQTGGSYGNGDINPNDSSGSPESSMPTQVTEETTKAEEEPKNESSSNTKPKAKKKTGLSLLTILSAAEKAITPAELTPEEKDAREGAIKFLDTNGPFSYASIDPFIQGLMNDKEAINKEVEKVKEEENMGEGKNLNSEDEYIEQAKKRIAERARNGLVKGLKRLRVNPSTASKTVTSSNTVRVTSKELIQFQSDMDKLDEFSKRAVPVGMGMAFRDGLSARSVSDFGNGKVPYGGKLVSVSQEE